jgi:transposase
MSLQAQPIPPITELTAKVAHRAFRKGNVYMQMRDLLGTFFTDDQAVENLTISKRAARDKF